ncbi:MAG: DUF4080 domain-containing protein [Geobacter sp.]|nr:DUF4080 domain-containing protein [Geobacter sp.]
MKLLLTTLHAKYAHASLALPYLAATCAGIDDVETVIREFTVNEPADHVLRRIVNEEADMVAFSCYIWNVEQTLRLVSDLKKVRPETFIILGGPEVSYGTFELMERNPAVDCVVRGEGETAFPACIRGLLESSDPSGRIERLATIPGLTIRNGDEIDATSPSTPIGNLDTIPSPFTAGLVDLEKPLVYFESSRGCPFSCAFCMSSLEEGVRSFSMERIRGDLDILLQKRARVIKFVDRTFNFDASRANAIWEHILGNNIGSMFHFEIAADLLTDANLELLRKVPAGMFRFEIGVQSGETETLRRVGRKSELERLFANVKRLREETGVVVHLDLVAGLPGEDFAGFLGSMERLFEVGPHHIQVEPLKVLKGSPMRRIAADKLYTYSDAPPYKILQNPWLAYGEICRIETIARLLDLVYNGGLFRATLRVLTAYAPHSTLFDKLAKFWEGHGLPTSISQKGLFEAIWQFGTEFLQEESRSLFADALTFDFCLTEYPSSGSLPTFFASDGRPAHPQRRVATEDIAIRLDIPRNARVRTFSRLFCRDFGKDDWPETETELTFVYISAPGKGLRVKLLGRGE